MQNWDCDYVNNDEIREKLEWNLLLRYATAVGKYPETIWFLVGFEPATFGMGPTRLACVEVECLIHSTTRTALPSTEVYSYSVVLLQGE